MKILVVGSGGREHAVCRKLAEEGSEVYAFMKNENPGIAAVTRSYVTGDEKNFASVADYAGKVGADLVFVGPDPVLDTPLVDTLLKDGFRVASPSRSAARIETSKEYMRDLLARHNIGDKVQNSTFSDSGELRKWLGDFDGEFVVKPLGLTGGKGVKVMGDHFSTVDEGFAIAESIIRSDGKVLIEEKLVGEEFSLQAFSDGKSVYPMPIAQDYKRAYENDTGPNTGGMGAITASDFLLPFIGSSSVEKARKSIAEVVAAMRSDGNPFRGILYAQFMETVTGPRIVEINSRFADPEGISVLSVMKSSLTEILSGIADGSVTGKPEFHHKATVLKYIVPEGYGSDPRLGPLRIPGDLEKENRRLYYASVRGTLNSVEMTNSRAIALVGISDSIPESSAIVDDMLPFIDGNYYVRKDIGRKYYLDSKVEKMKKLRESRNA